MSHPFDKDYFHGGAKVGGYAGSGYRDFPVHWNTFDYVRRLEPQSVIELGCGRGYTLKRIRDYLGIPVRGLEISEHCWLTRAISEVVTCDITKPWIAVDHSQGYERFDLCLSVAVLEHIPEDKLPAVFEQMARYSTRGIHGVDIHDDDGFDQTHVTIRPLEWWQARMPPGHVAVDKEDLERGGVRLPVELTSNQVKLNLGSFTHMFHGWLNFDRVELQQFARENGHRFGLLDLLSPLPYDAGRVDMIFMSHVLEHFAYDDGAKILAECRRVLKPGGTIRIAVPDLAGLMTRYADDDIAQLSELCGFDAKSMTSAQIFYELLIGGDHRAVYDAGTLMRMMDRAGLRLVAESSFGASRSPVMRRETIDQYPDLSLYVEASG